MKFLEEIFMRAKKELKNIVLPEGFDKRVLEAASIISEEGFANVAILGKIYDIENTSGDFNLSKTLILDHLRSPKLNEYAKIFYDMRKTKGLSLDAAHEIMKDPLYFGAMMVKSGEMDGMVAGVTRSTSDTLRCCLQTVKMAESGKKLTTCTILVMPTHSFGSKGILIFADTAMYENPTSEELSNIALSSGKFFKTLTGEDPKIAMLSYSTKGSAQSVYTEKIVRATKIAKENSPNLIIDGEMQFDAAVIPSVCKIKAPGSPIAGNANVLIFPDLNSANIACKIAERFGNVGLYGPVCQGLAKPINDISRGCSAYDIAGMVAITAIQCRNS